MSKAEMEQILDPARYTGRCAQQVEAFLELVKPLIAWIEHKETEIDL